MQQQQTPAAGNSLLQADAKRQQQTTSLYICISVFRSLFVYLFHFVMACIDLPPYFFGLFEIHSFLITYFKVFVLGVYTYMCAYECMCVYIVLMNE